MRGLALGFIVAIFACFSSSVIQAQGSVAISFRVLCADGPLPQDLRFIPAPNAPAVPVPFVQDARSVMLSYRGPERLAFFREPKSAVGPGVRATVASVAVPASTRQALLVFLPGGDPTKLEEYSIVLVEEPDLRLARSTIRFLNLSPARLLVKLDAENREIAGWRFEDFRFRVKQVARVPYGLAAMKDDQWEVILDSDLVLAADRRYLMLLLPPVDSESLRFRLKLLEE